jgi:hypothetical protein
MICKQCEKQLPINRKTFCDRKCSSLFQNKTITKNCLYCDKIFSVGNNRKDISKYCSVICRSKDKSENSREIRLCKICNVPFEEYKKTTRDFCSDECRTIWSKSPIKI